MRTTIICIQTLCGRISPAGFGSRKDRALLENAREQTGATLLGAASLRAGDPELRTCRGRLPKNRIRAVITRSGNIPLERSLFRKGPRPLIFSPETIGPLLKDRFRNSADVIGLHQTPKGMLPLEDVLNHLEDRGAESCLIEGGGRLNYEALSQGVVDELLVTIAPRLLGKTDEASLISGTKALGDPFINLELLSCQADNETGELFLHYRVKRSR